MIHLRFHGIIGINNINRMSFRLVNDSLRIVKNKTRKDNLTKKAGYNDHERQ